MFKDVVAKELIQVLGMSRRNADVGIELELEGHHLPNVVPNWLAKPEGSLQNGIEYITKPIKIDAVEAYTNNLNSFISSEGGLIVPSYRCSTHVHVNVTTETVADILGFYAIFVMFEQVLLRMCGNERNGNLFCMSSTDTGDIVNNFEAFCRTFHLINSHGYQFSRGKYSSFNLDRLRDLGTLEARCFPLCVTEKNGKPQLDGAKLKRWCSWLLTMKGMAKAEPDKTFRSLWKNIRQNPEWYCIKIFGDDFWEIGQAQDLMEVGTELGYELTRCLKKWYAAEDSGLPKKRGILKKRLSVPDPTAELAYEQMMNTIADDTEF